MSTTSRPTTARTGTGHTLNTDDSAVTRAAVDLHRRGRVPLALTPGTKRPNHGGWQRLSYANELQVVREFTAMVDGVGLGVRLGGGLADVDLDDAHARRAARLLLPPTPMRSGRESSPASHWWYLLSDDSEHYVNHSGPGGEVLVEVRADGGHQTVVPPSVHPSGEVVRWEGSSGGAPEDDPWQPAEVSAAEVLAGAAAVALVAVLAPVWPGQGSRHPACLALSGALLRGAHAAAGWPDRVGRIVETLAELTGDEDARERAAEAVPTTVRRLSAGGQRVTGWTTLDGLLIADDPSAVVAAAQRAADALRDALGVVVELGDRVELVGDHDAHAIAAGEVGGGRSPEESVRTWREVDLTPYLDGSWTAPVPTVGHRADGAALFYRGRVHSIAAETEAGKTWLALSCGAEEMAAGEHVLYLDMEDDAGGAVGRLLALGVAPEMIGERFHYVRPEGPLTAGEWEEFGALLSDAAPSLVVLDGVTNAMSMHGLDPLSNRDVAEFLHKVVQRLVGGDAHEVEGAAVLMLDHVTKAKEGRGRNSIGAIHKINALTGSAFILKARDPIRPGSVGCSEVYVSKDRPGQVRARAVGKPLADGTMRFADLVVDSTGGDEESSSVRVELVVVAGGGSGGSDAGDSQQRSAEDAVRLAVNMDRVWRLLHKHPEGLSGVGVGDALKADVKGGGGIRIADRGAALHALQHPDDDGGPYITATPHKTIRRFYLVTDGDDDRNGNTP